MLCLQICGGGICAGAIRSRQNSNMDRLDSNADLEENRRSLNYGDFCPILLNCPCFSGLAHKIHRST